MNLACVSGAYVTRQLTAVTSRRPEGERPGACCGKPVLKGQPDRVYPVILHRFPPKITVNFCIMGGTSGGELIVSICVNRALHFGSYWFRGRSPTWLFDGQSKAIHRGWGRAVLNRRRWVRSGGGISLSLVYLFSDRPGEERMRPRIYLGRSPVFVLGMTSEAVVTN